MKRLIFSLLAFLSLSAFAQTPNNARMLSGVNSQTGTTYSFVAADATRLTTFANASSIAVTLANPATTGFLAGNEFDAQNLGPGTATITCTSCLIFSANSSGASTLALSPGQGAFLFSSGLNYYTVQSGSAVLSLTSQPGYWLSGDGTPFKLDATLGVFTTGVANQLKCLLSRLPSVLTVNNLSFRMNTTGPAASHVAIGVYTATGLCSVANNCSKVFSWDNINSQIGSPTTFNNTITTVTMQPGMYWMCTSGDYAGTSPQASSEGGYAIPSSSYVPSNSAFGIRIGTAANPLSGGVMPATLGTITPVQLGQFAGFAMEP